MKKANWWLGVALAAPVGVCMPSQGLANASAERCCADGDEQLAVDPDDEDEDHEHEDHEDHEEGDEHEHPESAGA